MTSEEKMSRIVDRLLERTRSRELTWETGVFDDAVVTSFTDSSVRIFLDNESKQLAVSAIDSHGRTTQTVPADSLTNKKRLQELYELARHQVADEGGDETLDAILETLAR